MTASDAPDALANALDGKGSADVEVARGERPPLLDGHAVRALMSPLLAAFMIAAAVFRAQLVGQSIDALGLILRMVAFAFVVRAVLLIGVWLRRVAQTSEGDSQGLAWSPAGLLWRAGDSELFIPREDVLGLDLREPTQSLWGKSAQRPVWLTLRSEQRPRFVELPPYFASSPELLHARLARWWSPQESAGKTASGETLPISEERYLQAAQGTVQAGEVVIAEGNGWLRRGPYGALLLAFLVLDALRLVGPTEAASLQMAAVALAICAATPIGWYVWMRRRAKVRRGIAALLAREAFVVQQGQDTISLAWRHLVDAEVEGRNRWSPFVGAYASHQLVLSAQDGSSMRFDADLLGVPPEVVAALCRAYKRGAI